MLRLINVLSKNLKVTNVFKFQKEFDDWKTEFDRKIAPRLKKLERTHRKSREFVMKDHNTEIK